MLSTSYKEDMNGELVSVIMATYNPDMEKLKKSVDSIINQTHHNFELIICDDGSKREYKDKIEKVCSIDDRIKLITNKCNMGLAASLNNCLKVAKGAFIARQDDDDISMPRRFEIELLFLKKHFEYGFVGCAIEMYDDDGVWNKASVIKKPNKKDFLKRSPFSHPTIMVRKKVYDKVGGYRVSWETKRAQDYDMFMRMYAKGIRGYNIDKILYRYYESKESYKKVKLKHKFGEVMIRLRGFKSMGVFFPLGWAFVVKPLISYFIPSQIRRIKKKLGSTNG